MLAFLFGPAMASLEYVENRGLLLMIGPSKRHWHQIQEPFERSEFKLLLYVAARCLIEELPTSINR